MSTALTLEMVDGIADFLAHGALLGRRKNDIGKPGDDHDAENGKNGFGVGIHVLLLEVD